MKRKEKEARKAEQLLQNERNVMVSTRLNAREERNVMQNSLENIEYSDLLYQDLINI